MPLRRTLALPLLAAALLAAGCVAPEPAAPAAAPESGPLDALTEPTLAFGEFLALEVASHDGTRLHVDVQLPEGEGPFPTLIEYTPYSLLGDEQWGAVAERGLYGSGLAAYALADKYVPRGYAVAVAHVRGTGESGGCLTVGGPDEGKDGYAIVEHVAGQSWSNGKVALMGTSYVGTTPIETAVLDPPHLTTIVPVSAVTSWYKYYFENGEQRMNGSPPPGASYPDPALWLAMGVAPGPRTLAADPEDASCVAEYTRQFWLQDDLNAYWKARDHGALAAQIRAPVLMAMGQDDENVATNMLTGFWENVTAEKRLWLQQHGHGVPGSKAAYYEYEHRWLDFWMHGKRNGALDLPAVVVEDNRGRWRAEPSWPAAEAAPLRLWLADGGRLEPQAPAEGAASFRDDGVGRMADETLGRTWLRFASAPVANDTLVSGAPLARLVAASDAADTQWTILLYDEAPDGSLAFLTRGYLDARHREGLERGADVKPGEALAYEWLLHPRDHVVEKGHAIVAVVKSSDPYVIPDATRALNEIRFGAEGSRIDLPVADAVARAFADEAPRPASWGPAGG